MRIASDEYKEFTRTPSGRWYRCLYCEKLLPSHDYRTATLNMHKEFECDAWPQREEKEVVLIRLRELEEIPDPFETLLYHWQQAW